ncbi:hypothetical protein [Viridibacillus arvi]|uniref:hypothetical protein n=1 Tax=Viridibacillus arvi TaxID=263475 RepID=UPI0034CF5FE5
MIYTLPDVKKALKGFLKEGFSIEKITISYAEFGEGFEVYVNVPMRDKWLNKEFEVFTMSEEEKESSAIKRCTRVSDSLIKQGYKVIYEGFENC